MSTLSINEAGRSSVSAERAESSPVTGYIDNEDHGLAHQGIDTSSGFRMPIRILGAFFVFFNGTYICFWVLPKLLCAGVHSIFYLIQHIMGRLFDLGYYRTLLITGSCLATCGTISLSFSREYVAIILSQGVCTGLGFGLLYVPTISFINKCFPQKRALALGIATSGAPAGGIVYTTIFNQLITKIQFAWTVRVLGLVMCLLFLAASAILLPTSPRRKHSRSTEKMKVIDLRALKDIPFWSYTLANFFLYLGYITPYFYIPTYAQTRLHTTSVFASNILIITQVSSIIGRVATTIIAHHFGSMMPWIFCGTLSGVLCLCWTTADTSLRFIAFSAFYGEFILLKLVIYLLLNRPGGVSGALIPLPQSVFPHICPNQAVLGTWLGMAQSMGSFASLLGPPVAGLLGSLQGHNNSKISFTNIQDFSGSVMIFGAIQLVGLWYLLCKKRNKPRIF
ncbi:uncharacterized protein N7458_004864 [Penicillium daleae]|uniref:Major facilitator superfamily (MFS) profile domain-containing protein n=1 Tax=Penicillium daleae TaxID=63821 RepID=A0AAD6G3B9_9EURO|nr:uncharacterized protein N7458_004864 [Penicillium daleae]KAJ5453908.1 hypothetical protein N7458_004864 [Penicillium daleae]